MDGVEIVAYKRSWSEMLSGAPAPMAVRGTRSLPRPTQGPGRPQNERRLPDRNSLAYFRTKPVQTMGGSSPFFGPACSVFRA